MEKPIKTDQCSICHRTHRPDQPCPLRIANAYTMQVMALDLLTKEDKAWMASHKDFSVLDAIEDTIANQI